MMRSDSQSPLSNAATIFLDFSAILSLIGAAVAVAFAARTTFKVHSALPFWDEWETTSDLRTAMTHGIIHVPWMARHGEHTIALTRAIAIADGYFARGTNVFAVGAVWVMMLALAVLIAVIASPRMSTRWPVRLGVAGFVILFLFQPRNLENLSWGFQTSFAGVYLFALLAIDAAGRSIRLTTNDPDLNPVPSVAGRGWMAAAISAVSMGNGFMAGPMCALAALVGKAPRWYRVGSVVTAVICLLPFLNLRAALESGASIANWSIPVVVPYLVALLGSPFVVVGMKHLQFAVLALFGVVYVMGFTMLFPSPLKALAGSWTKVMAATFLLASIIAIAIARSRYAHESAYAGRYLVPVVAWWAVSLGLTVDLLSRRPWLLRAGTAAIAVGVAVGTAAIVSDAASESRFYLRKGHDNRMAEAMILSGLRDDRLIKRIGAWPEGGDDLIDFLKVRRLGPFASARSRWVGQQAAAVFPAAVKEDLSNRCVVRSVSPVFGNGRGLGLNYWSWIPSSDRTGWLLISGTCGVLQGEGISGDVVVLQDRDDRIAGIGVSGSVMIDRGRPDQASGSIQHADFEAYASVSDAQRVRVAVVDHGGGRLRILADIAIDPAKIGWRTAVDRESLVGTIDGATIDGRPHPLGECLPLTRTTKLRLSGWAIDNTTRAPVSAVIVFPEDGPPVFTGYGYPRDDVARYFGAEQATHAGWNVEMNVDPGKDGDRLTVVALSEDGLGKKLLGSPLLICRTGRTE
jgi:hypothetical protein